MPKTSILPRALVLFGLATGGAGAENIGSDPGFNGGIPVEDRFAGANANNYLASRILRLASGDLVAIGLVPAAFQSGGGNIGLVSYSAFGARMPWSSPSAPYASYFDNYVQYPNSVAGAYTAISDARVLGAYIIVEATRSAGGGNLDVDLVVFRNDGSFIGAYPAFSTALKEVGSGLATYAYFLAPGITARRLIAVATYSVFNPNERQIVTVKRFALANDGTLSV